VSRTAPTAVAAAWALAGAGLALAVGLAALGRAETRDLIAPLAVAVVLTVAATAVASRKLTRGSLRARFVAIAAFAVVLGLVNLAVLASLMLVSEQDAKVVAVLLIYAAAVAIGGGLAAGRASALAIERISSTAMRMADGDLDVRAGSVGGGAGLAIAQRRERAIEAQRRDLIVAVSHDLRTPLADLQAMAEAIEDRVVSDPAAVAEYAGRMNASVDSLARLVDDLFEFVSIDADAIEAERERLRVVQVVDRAVAACDVQAALKGLHLRTELGDAAEAECSPRLTRVLQNLLSNAIRHTPADGTVSVQAHREPGAIELAVTDTGEGIDAEAIERVFEPFWRGDEARTTDGTGLGLALAKRIVESLGGRIEVESAPPAGARFAVVVPAGDRAAS
jgi:signal transduction histidine kinase